MTKIKRLLLNKNMPQAQLARQTGVNRVEITMVANRKKIAYPLERKLIAQALGVEVGALFDDEGFARLEEGDEEEQCQKTK